MQETLSTAHSVDSLHHAAQHAGPQTHVRLAEVQALFADDLQAITRELARATRTGLAPATDAAEHLLRAGGKRIRPLTVLLSAACFGPVTQATRSLAAVAELVHLATLLHDDVLDDCGQRRGITAARCVWGNAVSVLSGDLLLTHALERTSELQPRALLPALIGTLRRLVDGEVLQLRGRSQLDLTQDTYFRIVRDKTASLFEWSGRAGAMSAGASEAQASALAAFGRHLGTAFQLIDDTLDYCGSPEQTGKDLCTDLHEGKITLPLLHALARDRQLLPEIEALRAGDASRAARVASAVVELGACESVRALARVETSLARQALSGLPPSPARELLLSVALELTARSA